MANQNFSMVHSLCTHGQSNSQRIGRMADHFKFLISQSDAGDGRHNCYAYQTLLISSNKSPGTANPGTDLGLRNGSAVEDDWNMLRPPSYHNVFPLESTPMSSREA